MGKVDRNPRISGRRFVLAIILVAVATLDFGEAKNLHAKSKKIHKFFDDDGDLFDLPEEEEDLPSPPTPYPPETTNSVLTFPMSETVKQVTDVLSTSDGNGSSLGLSSGRNSSRDRCAGIRCRVGRICQVDSESDGAWCVCAGAGHCVDHGRRVCGSDGRFYFSHCELHRTACVENQRIRVHYDQRTCIRRLLKTEADEHRADDNGTDEHRADERENSHDSKTEPSTKNSLHQFTDASRHQTRFPSSTKRTTVDNEPNALLPEPKHSVGGCSEEEYRRIVEKVLQQFCERTGMHACTDIYNWKVKAVKSMFGYYDRNSNQLLDRPEISAMQMDLAEHEYPNPEKIHDSCRLTDIVKSYPETSYLALNYTELCALLGILSLIQKESVKVFTVSATVGTSLEMKCDTVGKTDYTWRRDGDLLTDNTDNKIKVFDDGSLYISEVFLYHVGNYTCEERSSSQIIQTHLVSVHVPPIVRVNPKIRFLAPRSTITIDCFADGIPAPNVSWMVNDLPLPNKPDHYALLNNGLSLQIRDVDYSVDTGTFKCRANNFAGLTEDVSTIFIENDDSYQDSYSDELHELFVVFHADGYTVYEPGRCHMHHVVKGDYEVEPRDAVGGIATLCESNATCEWGAAVNVKNMFVYVSQPKLNRIIVIELQDRFNPAEVITVDEKPMEIDYVEHLDQVWVSCSVNEGGSHDTDAFKTLVIIQRASANVRHGVIHTQPIMDQFDKVRKVFLPPVNAFKQVFDYGFVMSKELSSVHKIDLNTMTYVKELSLKSLGDCVVNDMTFVPLAGKVFVNCKEASDIPNNLTSLCFAIDYVTDKIASTTVTCGDSFVSPDSRHLVVISGTRKNLRVYRVEDDGSIEPKFNREIDLRVGELTFKESEGGYDLFANSPDRPDILYMSLTSGYMDIIKDDNFGHSSDSEPKTQDIESQQPIVSGGVFSDYVLTSLTDAVRVIDVKRRHVQCEWQDVETASVIAWVEVQGH